MVAPKVPKPRMALPISLFGILCIFYLTACLSWNASKVVQGTGISIDIIGVVVLAIPDLPFLQKHFYSGKLKAALNHLRFENEGSAANLLAAPNLEERLIDALYVVENAKDCTVDELLDTIEVVRERTPSNTGFYELREELRKESDNKGGDWDNVYGFKTFDGQRGSRSIVMREVDGTPRKRIEGPYHMVFGPIETRVEEYDARIRILGLTLLLIGFLFQLSSLFFTQTG